MARTPLFVYGTLHPERAPAEIVDDVCRFHEVGSGWIRGRLLQLPGYPALLTGPGCDDQVQGTIFEVPHDPALIARLDAYEGYLPEDSAASLFLRRKLPVTLHDGSECKCWVYVYNQAIPTGS